MDDQNQGSNDAFERLDPEIERESATYQRPDNEVIAGIVSTGVELLENSSRKTVGGQRMKLSYDVDIIERIDDIGEFSAHELQTALHLLADITQNRTNVPGKYVGALVSRLAGEEPQLQIDMEGKCIDMDFRPGDVPDCFHIKDVQGKVVGIWETDLNTAYIGFESVRAGTVGSQIGKVDTVALRDVGANVVAPWLFSHSGRHVRTVYLDRVHTRTPIEQHSRPDPLDSHDPTGIAYGTKAARVILHDVEGDGLLYPTVSPKGSLSFTRDDPAENDIPDADDQPNPGGIWAAAEGLVTAFIGTDPEYRSGRHKERWRLLLWDDNQTEPDEEYRTAFDTARPFTAEERELITSLRETPLPDKEAIDTVADQIATVEELTQN